MSQQAIEQIFGMIGGGAVSRAICCIAEFGVADLIPSRQARETSNTSPTRARRTSKRSIECCASSRVTDFPREPTTVFRPHSSFGGAAFGCAQFGSSRSAAILQFLSWMGRIRPCHSDGRTGIRQSFRSALLRPHRHASGTGGNLRRGHDVDTRRRGGSNTGCLRSHGHRCAGGYRWRKWIVSLRRAGPLSED